MIADQLGAEQAFSEAKRYSTGPSQAKCTCCFCSEASRLGNPKELPRYAHLQKGGKLSGQLLERI